MNEIVKNKYLQYYVNIIRNARSSQRRSSSEHRYVKHHIFPKSLYPSLRKNKKNLVMLTNKEHYVCHHLLWKFTTGNSHQKMIHAFWFMCHTETQQQTITARVYSVLRAGISELKRQQVLEESNKFSFSGKTHSVETKRKLSVISKKTSIQKSNKSLKRIKERLKKHNFSFIDITEKYIDVKCNTCDNEFTKQRQQLYSAKFNVKMCETCNPKEKYTYTDEHKEKIREANKGKIVSSETRARIRKAVTGKKHTTESKAKMSESRKGKQTGKDNPMFGKTWSEETRKTIMTSRLKNRGKKSTGYYVTPWGKFATVVETLEKMEIPTTISSIRRWCKENNGKKTRSQSFNASKYLYSLGEGVIGKTFKELGFGYEECQH